MGMIATNLDMSSALGLVSTKAAEAKENRQISSDVVEALKKTGFFRHFLPKAYGGNESGPVDFFKASIDIAEQDMSASWAMGIVAVHAYQLALMDPKACEAVYGETGPDTLISSSYNPTGAKVKTVDGGFEFSGRWGWSSGSHHCSWVLLGGVIMDHPSGPHYRTFLLPREQYEIEDTWFPMGLHGTGSNDIVIDKPVFVPEHMTHHQMDGFNSVHSQKNPIYNIPWAQIFVRVVNTPAIGAAKHALALFTGNAAGSSTDTTRLAGDPDVTRRVSEAANLIDETEAVMFRNFEDMVDKVTNGVEIPMIDRARYRYQASLVIPKMIQAVDLLFDVAGGRSVYTGASIQDLWHDIHIARAHVANNPVAFARNWGAMHMGADNTDVFI